MVSLCVWKGNERKWKRKGKGNKNVGKQNGNEIKEKWKGKLSDPSPFNNLLSKLIKYSSHLELFVKFTQPKKKSDCFSNRKLYKNNYFKSIMI